MSKFDKKSPKGSVPNWRLQICNRYDNRWFKCKLKPPKNGSSNIKYRLRKTPKKVKDVLSETNVQHLKKVYQSESNRLQLFLSPKRKTSKGPVHTATYELDNGCENNSMPVCATQLNKQNAISRKAEMCEVDATGVHRQAEQTSSTIAGCSNIYQGDKCDNASATGDNYSQEPFTPSQPHGPMHIGNSYKRSQQEEKVSDYTVHSSKIHNNMASGNPESGKQQLTMTAREEVSSAELEIQKLHEQLNKAEVGSVQRLLLEMRLDMKQDLFKMMGKIDKVVGTTDKLMSDVSQLKTDRTEMQSQITSVQETQSDEVDKLKNVTVSINNVQNQVRILKGMVQKHSQINLLSDMKTESQLLHNMQDDLLISGLDEEDNETETTTAELVTDFFTHTMKITQAISIRSAIRVGKATPRAVKVKLVNAKDKSEIFKNAKNLKNAKNNNDGAFYIDNALTPRLQEERRWSRYLMKYNKSLTGTGKRNMTFKKGKLLIDGHPFVPAVQPPDVNEVVYPLDEAHVSRIKLHRGKIIRKGNCVFIGYAVNANGIADVRAAYTKIARIHSDALSISCGYRLAGMDYPQLRGAVDDKEHGAGRTIYFMLENQNRHNKAIFVVRYFGNKHLGPIRYQLIRDAAKLALDQSDTVQDQQTQVLKVVGGQKSSEEDQEVVFKMPAPPSVGYISVASPRPFGKSTWGSVESVDTGGADSTGATDTNSVMSEHGIEFRARASSMDSALSYRSVNSTPGAISSVVK